MQIGRYRHVDLAFFPCRGLARRTRTAPSGLQHNGARPGPADPDLLAPVEVVLIPARAIGTRNADQPAVGEKDVVDRDIAKIGDFLDLSPGDIVRRVAFGRL